MYAGDKDGVEMQTNNGGVPPASGGRAWVDPTGAVRKVTERGMNLADVDEPEPNTEVDKAIPDEVDCEMILDSWHNTTYWWGTALLFFSVVVVMHGIFQEWNNPPWDHSGSHPLLEFVLFWTMLFWIAMLEGCQISVVGLQGYDPECFRESHPRAYRLCKLVHHGPNVERFLVGRQFLLLFNGFLVSRVGGGTAIENFEIGGWEWTWYFTQFFYSNGVLLMIVIVALGQLPSQLVAADKMLGFFDLPLGHYYVVIMPCLIVESIGLTHSSYLLKDFLCWLCGIDQSLADPSKALKKDGLHWAKCLLSVSAVTFSGIMIIKGISLSQTNATEGAGWDRLPGGAAVVVSLFFIFMLASAEGIQISVVALMTVPGSQYKSRSPLAYKTAKLSHTGRNMSAFLAGRQFLTAMNMVLLARVTSYAGSDGELLPGGDWGMGKFFNEYLLQWGFLGAILVVNVAQLASQVTASLFPIAVINNVWMYWLLNIMLFVEACGIINACWPLAYVFEKVFEMKPEPPLKKREMTITTFEAHIKSSQERIIELKKELEFAEREKQNLVNQASTLQTRKNQELLANKTAVENNERRVGNANTQTDV